MQWSAINYTCLYSNFQGNWFKGSKGWLNPFVSPLCCNASSSSVLAARRPGGILDKMNKNDPRRSLVAHKSMSTVCLLSSVIVLLSSQSAPCEASSVWLWVSNLDLSDNTWTCSEKHRQTPSFFCQDWDLEVNIHFAISAFLHIFSLCEMSLSLFFWNITLRHKV